MILHCTDFELGKCCDTCHEKKFYITVYPWSVYSDDLIDGRMPDLALGILAEICCARFDYVRSLPRTWWVNLYAINQKWPKEAIEKLLQATKENYYQILGEVLRSKTSGESIRSQGATSVSRVTKSAPRAKAKSECPKCGETWGEIICGNCGHAG